MAKAIILAAGRGKRLFSITHKTPKPLINICGKPLIEHVINTLKTTGITHYIIVTGYLRHLVQKHIGDGSKFNVKIEYAYNPRYNYGNAISLKAAQKFIKENETFLLTMSDHILDTRIIRRALKNLERKPLLCVDRKLSNPSRVVEATKVLVNSKGFIVDIGKEIPVWNAIDTGVFVFNDEIFDVIERMDRAGEHPLTLSRCVKRMAEEGNPLWACDVSGFFWLDIDTPEDVAFAESALGESLKCRKDGTA